MPGLSSSVKTAAAVAAAREKPMEKKKSFCFLFWLLFSHMLPVGGVRALMKLSFPVAEFWGFGPDWVKMVDMASLAAVAAGQGLKFLLTVFFMDCFSICLCRLHRTSHTYGTREKK